MIYLDYNATAPLRPAVRDALVAAMEHYGNPSSVHSVGRAARAVVEQAREGLARYMQMMARQVLFTASATEANVTVVRGGSFARIITSVADHDSLQQPAQHSGVPVEYCPVTANGTLCLNTLATLLQQPIATLLCTTAVNSEIGVIQPLAAIDALVRHAAAPTHWHIDAVQAFGKLLPEDFCLYGDSITLAFHKIGGCRGLAALLLRNESATPAPLLHGGGQEMRRRAGTENVLAAAALTALLGEAEHWPAEQAQLAQQRNAFEAEMQQAGALLVAALAPRVGNTSCVILPNKLAEHTVIGCDLRGLCLSAGSACSSGKVKCSALLHAMNLGHNAACAVRLSGGFATLANDWHNAAHILRGVLG